MEGEKSDLSLVTRAVEERGRQRERKSQKDREKGGCRERNGKKKKREVD